MLLEQQQRQTWQQRIDWVLWQSDYEFPQVVMSIPLLGWGVILMLPGNTFVTSPAFNNLAFWPETWWGALSGILFCFYTLSGLFGWRRVFAVASLFAAIWWLFVSASIFLAQPLATGNAVYPPIFGMTGWVFLRHMARHDVLKRSHEQR